MVELLDGPDQSEVAFLNQVRERQAEVPVILRDGDDKLQIMLNEAVLDRSHLLVGIFYGVNQDLHPLLRHADLEL